MVVYYSATGNSRYCARMLADLLGDSLTREGGDALLELVEATEGTHVFDYTIESIIKEEAAAFFAGDKTAQETADLIQSRVSLYLGEQR